MWFGMRGACMLQAQEIGGANPQVNSRKQIHNCLVLVILTIFYSKKCQGRVQTQNQELSPLAGAKYGSYNFQKLDQV